MQSVNALVLNSFNKYELDVIITELLHPNCSPPHLMSFSEEIIPKVKDHFIRW